MAKSTLYSHIDEAIQMQKRLDSTYYVIGKTSAWSDDNNPPEEDSATTTLTEVIGYKKVKRLSLVRPLAEGEETTYPVVAYGGQQWALIPVDKAYEEGARWLYVEAEIFPNDLPLGWYRQVGVHMGLKPVTGIFKQNLLPTEVGDPGVLKFYENREPQNRTANVYVLEQFIVKV